MGVIETPPIQGETVGDPSDGDVVVAGAVAEATVPTELADGEVGNPWYDTFMRGVVAGYDAAQNALSVSDISPAAMQVARWLDWVALTTPGDETPPANVQDYSHFTIEYVIASIDTNVTLKFWGSIDGGVTWFLLTDALVKIASDDQTDTISFDNMAIERIKCEFDDETGGTAATVTFKVMAGN